MKHTCINDGNPARRRSKTCAGYWCDACDKQFRLYGDPLAKRRRRGSEDSALREAATSVTDDCIIFEGRAARGQVRFNGTCMNASRAVWFIANGDPGKMHVLHSCSGGTGDSGCINIRHLYLGDDWRNRWDMVNAGRTTSRLTRDDVEEILAAYVPGARFPHSGSSRALAIRFGVRPHTISSIASLRRTWIHVNPAP